MEYVVGIGAYAVSDNSFDVIKTFALSTCVGMVYYSMRKRCMGMAHIQLPNCRSASLQDKPSRFADAAPKFLLEEMTARFGVTRGEVLISLYGGIDGRGESDCFRIGEKNLATVKEAFKALGLIYNEVDTGGNDSRTLVAYVGTGVVEVLKRPMIGSEDSSLPAVPSGFARINPPPGVRRPAVTGIMTPSAACVQRPIARPMGIVLGKKP
ncbi:MAG: chemotaxis protein CheD [Oscillospiraceae bacterium]|nr:chemotaxis protein CheD [Oscillospiraceae bacterium]